MKKKIKLVVLFAAVFPMSLFAHTGHDHTGTFWENVVHFMITNGYLFVAVFVAGYFLLRNRKMTNRVKCTTN